MCHSKGNTFESERWHYYSERHKLSLFQSNWNGCSHLIHNQWSEGSTIRVVYSQITEFNQALKNANVLKSYIYLSLFLELCITH